MCRNCWKCRTIQLSQRHEQLFNRQAGTVRGRLFRRMEKTIKMLDKLDNGNRRTFTDSVFWPIKSCRIFWRSAAGRYRNTVRRQDTLLPDLRKGDLQGIGDTTIPGGRTKTMPRWNGITLNERTAPICDGAVLCFDRAELIQHSLHARNFPDYKRIYRLFDYPLTVLFGFEGFKPESQCRYHFQIIECSAAAGSSFMEAYFFFSQNSVFKYRADIAVYGWYEHAEKVGDLVLGKPYGSLPGANDYTPFSMVIDSLFIFIDCLIVLLACFFLLRDNG